MAALARCLLIAALTAVGGPALATNALALERGTPYREVRTTHEQFLADQPSRHERLRALRDIVRASPYGERGLQHIFKNFSGANAIDPTIPGVEGSARLLTSASPLQRKGYARELVYAAGLHNDTRFKLQAMNELRSRPWGSTDADLVAVHRPTGQRVRVEVKDVSLGSQQRTLGKLLAQIDKMAAERALTGELQYWVNRRAVLPAVKEYAMRRGVLVEGLVKTGAKSQGLDMAQLRRQIHGNATRADNARQFAAAAGLVFGPMLVFSGVDDLTVLWQAAGPGQPWTDAERRLALQRSLEVAGGAGITVYGATYAMSRFAGTPMQGTAFGIGRMAGAGGALMLGASQSVLIYRYVRGDVTGREFWVDQWAAAGGLAGVWLGGGLGAVIGGLLPLPGGTFVFRLFGSAGGGWLVPTVTTRLANSYYDWTMGEYDQRFEAKVYERYGVR